MTNDEIKARYGVSSAGNYAVIETIGVPHPYCITPKHVSYAATYCSGILNNDSIVRAERAGAQCGICKGELTYKEHEHALLVECKLPLPEHVDAGTELHAYLHACKPLCEADGYVGFAFKAPKAGDA